MSAEINVQQGNSQEQTCDQSQKPENLSEEISIPSSSRISSAVASDGDESLCPRCSTIDFNKLFNRRVLSRLGKFVIGLVDSSIELEASACSLCWLFASIAPRKEPGLEGPASKTPLNLRAFSAMRVFIGTGPAKFAGPDATVLGVVDISDEDAKSGRNSAVSRMNTSLRKTGYLYFTQPNYRSVGYGIRLIRAESFSVEFARDCITYCQENHGDTCKQSAAGSELSPFFKVIDCETRKVVIAPPKCKYVALSYVWGTPEPASSDVQMVDKGSDLDGFPKVISHAIECTMKLSFRYLWVDRLCINQSDAHEKHVQISQMDLIYANAQLTIISAPRDPNDGLPGVGGVLRKEHQHLHVRGWIIASTLPHPQWSVGNSKWITRGWTYQEGLLSKRRLIFTDEQILFECNSMHCAEALLLPLDSMHYKVEKTFREHVPDGPLGPKSPGTEPYDIMKYISIFSKRQLSFPEDRINAMKGIFHVFQSSSKPIHQLMGVPVMPLAQSWRSPDQGFMIGLTWTHRKPGTRIKEFPTWSWAGWSGELDPEFAFSPTSAARPYGTTVRIEAENGDLLPFPYKRNGIDNFLPSFSTGKLLNFSQDEQLARLRFIHLETYAFSGTTVQLPARETVKDGQANPNGRPRHGQQYLKVACKDGETFIYMEMNLDRPLKEHELSGKQFTGILVADLGLGLTEMAGIIVEEFDTHAERVAVSQIRHAKIRWSSGGWSNVGTYDRGKWPRRVWFRYERRKIRLG